MKYNMSAKVYNTFFSYALKKYYKEHFPDMNIKGVLKDIKKEYKAMILRTPGLNGNFMESNLVGAAWFFSLAKCMPNMTPQLMNTITDDAMQSNLMMKMHKKARETGSLFSDKVLDQRIKEGKESQTSTMEMDWKYLYIKGEDEYFVNFTKCGVCKLAERENMKEYLPCMCHMDYSKYRMQGAELHRTHTIADGDGFCDFHLVRIKK